MPGGQDRGSSIRPPAVAGMFYPADPAQCRRLARRLVEGDGGGAAAETAVSPTASSGEATRWLGGIGPHAGWIASGAAAGQSLRAPAASTREAPEIGRRTARQVAAAGLSALFLASSDLTHYGPSYRFAPAGIGPQGLAWAKDNDRRVLGLVTALAFDRVVPEVRQRANACGGGAIAAMLSACRELGATRAAVLRHANSFETLAPLAPQRPNDAVGYAAVVVG